MNKFKAGDRIKCINRSFWPGTKDKIYTTFEKNNEIRINNDDSDYYVLNIDSLSDCFELVTESRVTKESNKKIEIGLSKGWGF